MVYKTFISSLFCGKSALQLCGLLTFIFTLRDIQLEQFYCLLCIILYFACLFSISLSQTLQLFLIRRSFCTFNCFNFASPLPLYFLFYRHVFTSKEQGIPRYTLTIPSLMTYNQCSIFSISFCILCSCPLCPEQRFSTWWKRILMCI